MRRLGYKKHALIETLHAVQESFGYLDEEALTFLAGALQVPPSKVYGVALCQGAITQRLPVERPNNLSYYTSKLPFCCAGHEKTISAQ